MPTLPDLQSSPSALPAPQPAGGIATYEPPNWRQTGMAGQIVQGAGRELDDATNIIAASNDRQDNEVAMAGGNALQQQRAKLEFDPTDGFRAAKEGAAIGPDFFKQRMQQFQDSAAQIRQGLLNDNQRRIFDQHTQVQGAQFASALLQHQAQQTEAFNDSTADNSIKLALSSMAQRPQDELNFQTGLSQIYGTIDNTAQRKGLPAQAVTALKAQYLDAAYTTRISSILQGIPGVAPANPYLAERMFSEVQDQLQPHSQVQLAGQVQHAVQGVQARDTAQSYVNGNAALAPKDIAPGATGLPLAAAVQDMESGGNPNAVSSKGAQGAMQVMPATAANPGFGVRPAQMGSDGKPLPGELDRVGRDYLGAMTARYNDPALTLAAYNAGPAQTDQWIAKYGDPRTGQISDADWAAKLPFDETKNYVTTGLGKLGAPQSGFPAATANQLKTDLYQRVQAARDTAQQQYPGDTAYADSVAARVENYGRLIIANQQATEAAARDSLFQGIVGSKPDGSDKPKTIDQLLSTPDMQRAWGAATPETQLAIQTHFKDGASDPPRTPDTQRTYYTLLGQYANNRTAFANADLSPLIGQLPHADFDHLANLQVSARSKAEQDADKQTNLLHALSLANDYALKPAGIPVPTKDTAANQRSLYDQFTGRLSEQIDQFQASNQRPPSDKDIVGMARNLTTTVQLPGKWWGTTDKHAFEVSQNQEASVTAPLTPQDTSRLTSGFTARYGRAPQPSELQAVRVAELLHSNDPGYLRQLDAQIRTNPSAGAVK